MKPASRHPAMLAASSITALALVVRLACALAFGRTPLGRYFYLDARVYDDLAVALRQGTGAALEPFFVEPLYAYFLAAVYAVFGRDPWSVRILQALGGAATAALVFDLGRRLYGRRIGWAAGLAAAFYGPFAFYDALLLKTSLEVFLVALLLWLLVRGTESLGSELVWPAAGLVLGLAAILKANSLVLVPLALAAPFLARREAEHAPTGRRAAIRALAVLAGVALPTLPIVARNSLLAGEVTFLTTGAGMNFYQGNRPGTDGGLDIPEFIQLDPSREQQDSLAEARRRSGRPAMTAGDASGFWFAEAGRFIRDQPVAWVRLLARKTLLFWNHYEAADNLSFHYSRAVVPWLWLAPLGFWLVGPLGLAGALAGAGGGRGEALLRAAVGLLTVGTVLFHVADRYRLAAVPALLVLGCGLLRRIGVEWQRGARRRALGRAGLAAAAALLVNLLEFYPGGQDRAPFDRLMARGYTEQGDHTAAAPYGERAAQSFYRRGMVHLERGEFYRAEIYFASALDTHRDWPGAWYHLGFALERRARGDEAIGAYRRAVATDSFATEALTRLGRLHLGAGRLVDAESALLDAVERAPESVAALAALGDLRASQGQFAAALELFERAQRADPRAAWLVKRIEEARARL